MTHDHDDETETCGVTSGLNELQSEIDLLEELDSPRERRTPFHELSVADQCANGRDNVRLSGFRKGNPMKTIQASRNNNAGSAVLDLTTYTKQGDPLYTGRGELGSETWEETTQILEDMKFFSLDGAPDSLNSSLDTWHVEVCISGKYHSVRRQPREDATLRPLLNFLAGTEY